MNSEAEPGTTYNIYAYRRRTASGFPESGRGRCIPVSGNDPQSKADAVLQEETGMLRLCRGRRCTSGVGRACKQAS